MDIELSRDAKHAIACVYKAYLNRRKAGEPKGRAIQFNTTHVDYQRVSDSINDSRAELRNVGFIKCYLYGDFEITDKAIIYMENLAPELITKWLSFAAQFIP